MRPTAFKPQAAPVRPAQLETPHCYLHRLCVANCIDPTVVASLIAQRATDGHRHQMALAILELGGPHPIHFARSYLRATGAQTDDADKLLTDTYRRRTAVRYACTFCTAGRDVETFDHHRFCLCLRHGRWLAPGHQPHHQRPIPDVSAWVCAERHYRRAAATGFLTRRLIDATWHAVRDQAALLGPPAWTQNLHTAQALPGFIDGIDDRLALHPQTARLLRLLALPGTWYAVDALARSPEHLRAQLRRQLAWIPGDAWVLVEALTAELIYSRQARMQQLGRLFNRHPHRNAGPF